MDRIAPVFVDFRSKLKSFLECTSLKNTFEFVENSATLSERGDNIGAHGFFWNFRAKGQYNSDDSDSESIEESDSESTEKSDSDSVGTASTESYDGP